MNTLIGYTGFIGKNLIDQENFEYKYNSQNINTINSIVHDTIYCCGISANKFWANKNSDEDKKNIDILINSLKQIKCNKFILISTIDVYSQTENQNEENIKIDDNHHAYGKNRYYAELEFKKIFGDKLHIIRLPALFGKYLKKNILYDIIHNEFFGKINIENELQWYYVENLNSDILTMIDDDIKVLNLFTEPISIKEIIKHFFRFDLETMYLDVNNAFKYDLKTIYSDTGYWENKNEVINNLRTWLKKY